MATIINKAIFLDRDGVLNRSLVKNYKPYAPISINEFKIYRDIKLLNNFKKDYFLIVITNQPDVKTKKVNKKLIQKFHQMISNILKIDKFYICYHNDDDKCLCRKPGIKFFLDAKKRYNLSLKKSYFIGDRWKDMRAGNKAQCINIFLDKKYKESETHNFDFNFTCSNLKEAINYIKKREKIT